MKNGASSFTPERVAELRKNIDLSDIPEITDFSKGYLRNSRLTATIDSENLEWLKIQEVGYQERINFAIRWAREHNCPLP